MKKFVRALLFEQNLFVFRVKSVAGIKLFAVQTDTRQLCVDSGVRVHTRAMINFPSFYNELIKTDQ